MILIYHVNKKLEIEPSFHILNHPSQSLSRLINPLLQRGLSIISISYSKDDDSKPNLATSNLKYECKFP